MEKIIKWPATVWSLCIAGGLLIGLAAARAPTSYNGKLPFVGDNFPFELNAVYLIALGPIAAVAGVGALWMFVAFGHRRFLLGNKRRDAILLKILFVIIFVLNTILSLQYFLILAPAQLCPSRPHFDFLWRSVAGPERITHCMGGTEAVNQKAPFYLEPQIVQSWGHVLWPVLTGLFLLGAWRSWANFSHKACTGGRGNAG